MKQGKAMIDEFNTKFRILVQKAGLDEQENATLLMQFYAQGIGRDLARCIIIQEPPTTLSGWMMKASTLDGYERRANQFFTNVISIPYKGKGTFQKGRTFQSRTYTPKEDLGEPMDNGRLDPQEEKRRKDKNLCFNCGKPGHMA